jgi:nitroreductase
VWLGVYPREDRVAGVRQLLSIPEQATPLCVISVGYPVEPGGPVERYSEERVHRNGW